MGKPGAIAILVATAMLMLASCADRQALPAPSLAPTAAPTATTAPTMGATLTPTPPRTEVPLEARAEYAGLVCTVERARLQTVLAGEEAPKRRIWLVLNVVIENTGSEPSQAASYGFYAIDSVGTTYHDYEAPHVLNTLPAASLEPGERLRGVVTIPVKAHSHLNLFWLVIYPGPNPTASPDLLLGAIDF